MVKPPRNDGWHDLSYELLPEEPDIGSKIADLLNEAWHVHQLHRDGNWNGPDGYKDKYANLVLDLVEHRKSRLRKLLAANDRVLSMLVYRAFDLLEQEENSR